MIEMIETNVDQTSFDSALKHKILRAAKQSYENVRNSWAGEECFSCALMHDFFESLIHLHSTHVTDLLRDKIRQHLERTPRNAACLNQQCFGFESAEWKSSERSAVLSVLETVLSLMMDASCKSARPSERDDALLDLEYEINCSCSRCRKTDVQSERAISNPSASSEVDYNSLKVIEECLRSPNAQRVHDSARIDKIFDLLKEQRKQQAEEKQVRKQRHDLVFGLYGNLLGLEKEKMMEDAQVEGLERRKERVYEELLRRNGNNERIIRRFSRKAALQKSQDKIARLPNDLAASTPTPTSTKKATSKDSLTASTPLSSSRLLHRLPSGSRTGRREILEPIGSIQDCIKNYTRMQERVDRALKNYEPREERRTSILKSIVLNANDMFTERRLSRPGIDRPFFNRFERAGHKTSREGGKAGTDRPALAPPSKA